MQERTQPRRWTVIVPLKSSSRGKSRIEVDPVLRRRLVVAMAMDTVSAAAAADGVAAVVVVAEDAADGDRLAEIDGVRVRLTSTRGLNPAIVEGLSTAEAARGPVAVLPGDLPSLTALELGSALASAAAHPMTVVADRQDTGSTLLAAVSAQVLRPQYGPGSLRRHQAAGAVRLDLPVGSGLRRDVDRVGDLLGVSGRRTVAVLDAAGFVHALCGARPAV